MARERKRAKKVDEIYGSECGINFAVHELYEPLKHYVKHGSKILEIGCGRGRNFIALLRLPESQIWAVDISREILGIAAKKVENFSLNEKKRIILKHGDGRNIDFPDNSFDLIIAWQLIEHFDSLEDQKKVINESIRVIKDKGFLLIATPNRLFPIDYHDTNLPFVHWIFPSNLRKKIAYFRRGWKVSSNYPFLKGGQEELDFR